MNTDDIADGRTGSVDRAEVARFDALAATWWDPRGPMRVLHRFNPVRVAYIRDTICRHYGRSPETPFSLDGLSIVDVGCGGGVLSEPLARLGAEVTGLDPAVQNIAAARRHAEAEGVAVDYRPETIEAVVAAGLTFDVVLIMEVIEHVADMPAFVRTAAAALKPGGLLFAATLNRTMRSFALAIVGRRVRARLASEGHPRLGEVRHAGGTLGRAPRRRPHRHRHDRRRLQSADRWLAGEPRHGRELYAGGRRARPEPRPFPFVVAAIEGRLDARKDTRRGRQGPRRAQGRDGEGGLQRGFRHHPGDGRSDEPRVLKRGGPASALHRGWREDLAAAGLDRPARRNGHRRDPGRGRGQPDTEAARSPHHLERSACHAGAPGGCVRPRRRPRMPDRNRERTVFSSPAGCRPIRRPAMVRIATSSKSMRSTAGSTCRPCRDAARWSRRCAGTSWPRDRSSVPTSGADVLDPRRAAGVPVSVDRTRDGRRQ